jgi:DNA-binding CsgD family transcriptional regulator
MTTPFDRKLEGTPTVALHPWLVALDAFGVPFLCYGSFGGLIYSSTAASAIQGSSPPGLASQAERLARQALLLRPVTPAVQAWVRVHAAPAAGAPLTLHSFVCQESRERHPVAVVLAPHSTDQIHPALSVLSARECEVAQLIAAGASTKQVASHLLISVHTARHHIEHVYRKLGLHTRAEVARALA